MNRNPAKAKQKMRDIFNEEMAPDERVSGESSKSTGKLKDNFNSHYHQLKNSSKEFLEKEGKKLGDLENILKEYSDDLLKNMKKNPVTTVLIAAGVGFLLAAFFKKRS